MKENGRQQWEKVRGRWRIRAVRGGKWFRERGQKSLSAIPHLFTLANLALGVVSIMQTMRGNYSIAALLIGGSLLADGLDGRLARILKADGEFGKELDSLADIVSFGAAPAILLHEISLQALGLYGLMIALLFPMAGALRLARFNIIKTSGFFMGVPITAAGTYLAAICFYEVQEGTTRTAVFLLAAVALLLSYLMISTIPYPDFKKMIRQGESQIPIWLQILGPLTAILWVFMASDWSVWALLVLPLTAYVVLGPWLLLLRQLDSVARLMGDS